jgi:transcriptional regulator with XRE-family HTH domain
MSRKLQNYVRTYRKRAGLSQDEMAQLLGCRSGAKVSRYERFARQPTLETAFAYEAVFGAPAHELFGGVYEQSLAAIQQRARTLKEMLERQQPDCRTARKLELLSALSSSSQRQPASHS